MSGLRAFLSRPVAGVAPAWTGARPDALFAFAGVDARKEHAAERFRQGAAAALVLSVGRFEWRRYAGLGLPDGGLFELVARTPHRARHFFVTVGPDGATSRAVGRGPFGTWREARALAALARDRGWRSVVAVTSPFHVRRASLALARAARGSGLALAIEPLPAPRDPHAAGARGRGPGASLLLVSEAVKTAFYATFLWR